MASAYIEVKLFSASDSIPSPLLFILWTMPCSQLPPWSFTSLMEQQNCHVRLNVVVIFVVSFNFFVVD